MLIWLPGSGYEFPYGNKGKIEQAVGHLKQAGEKVKDALKTGSKPQGAPTSETWSDQWILRSCFAQYGARNSRLRIFPDGLRGNDSVVSTDVGHL